MHAKRFWIALVILTSGAAQASEPRGDVGSAVRSGLKIVEKAAANYPNNRDCFSCHHQTLPMLAMVSAPDRDDRDRKALLHEQGEFTRESFDGKIDDLNAGKGIGGGAMTVSYGLWALDLAGQAPSKTTEAMVEFLLKTQHQDGRWVSGSRRPPLEESSVTATVLSAIGVDRYASDRQRSAAKEAVARAKAWLQRAPVALQEDRTSKLFGLSRLGASPAEIATLRAAAIETQRGDGGWAPSDGLPSDAYATGQTLFRLREAGLSTADLAYQRGVAYLLKTRLPDGSWLLETRAKPVQAYFDNGDPHGRNQFISTPATAWAVVALAGALLPETKAEEPFDLMIRGGRIVDGTGNPWFYGDLAIRGDRIAALGRLPDGIEARRVIDAKGKVVSPGFVDMHSHSDMPLLEDGAGWSKVTQGVTTEVLGEDTSGGPSKGKRPPKTFHKGEKTLKWETLGGYFDAVEESGVAVNVASYVGLGTLLDCVLGDSLARPDSAQLDAMKTLLEEAMADGAIGLSTMLAGARELNVTTDDIVALAAVVKRHGGSYSSHIRNEGTDVLKAVDEAISIGERAGVPVDIIHIKIAEKALWGRMNELVLRIRDARMRGINVQSNVYPYTRGNNDLVTILPPWAHEGGKDDLLARLKNPSDREHIKHDIREGLPGWYNHYTAVGGDWSRMLISARLSDANARFQGKTMDAVLAERMTGQSNTEKLDAFLDFLADEKGSVSTIYAHHTEEDMNLALLQPWCSIGSDGSALAIEGPLRKGHPHPRSFGTFPRVLGVYVRERGLLTLEDAVRKMTSLNASKIGLTDRGLLRAGQYADVVVFDPATILDRSTYLEPFQYSEGIELVVVNGRPVYEHGKVTGARPGRALRRSKTGP
jgi:N-acyl-D-amino-acid deacylase